MSVIRCRECGGPIYTRIFRRWNSDGTVTGRLSSGVRICHIEAGEVCAMVEGVSARIGYPIDRIVVEGERKASRNITCETLSAGRGLLGIIGRSWGGSPVSLKISLAISRSVGFGAPEVLKYIRGRELKLKVQNPFCVPIVVGDLWGNFEALHRITAEASWEEEPGAVTINMVKVRDEMVEEYPDRLSLQKMATLPGDVGFDRCRRCGIPREVTGSIEWDLDAGVVTSRVTGRREVTVMVEGVNAVISELTGELGDEIPGMVQQVEQEYVAGKMEGSRLPDTTREYGVLLDELRVMGMGNPVEVEKEGERLKVRINNPFCEPLLAGRVGGYYKALEGVTPLVTWTPDEEGYTVIEANPA
ncbi:MAG: hypothetical protein KKE79_01505 [Actinobacteria bacterium]|nr:hypothetical protein [Actinomycetota bacterium]